MGFVHCPLPVVRGQRLVSGSASIAGRKFPATGNSSLSTNAVSCDALLLLRLQLPQDIDDLPIAGFGK